MPKKKQTPPQSNPKPPALDDNPMIGSVPESFPSTGSTAATDAGSPTIAPTVHVPKATRKVIVAREEHRSAAQLRFQLGREMQMDSATGKPWGVEDVPVRRRTVTPQGLKVKECIEVLGPHWYLHLGKMYEELIEDYEAYFGKDGQTYPPRG